jgi:serralysin
MPAGDATSISFAVTLRGDGVGEADETFVAEIFSVSGAELGTPASLTMTIQNDDPPTIRGCTTTTTVEAAPGRHTFRITSAVPMVAGVNVGYAYGGTASHGTSADYARVSPTASTGSVSFPAGATSVDFSIDTRDDVTDEPDETVTLTLLSVSPGATLDASCTVSTLAIEDDD